MNKTLRKGLTKSTPEPIGHLAPDVPACFPPDIIHRKKYMSDVTYALANAKDREEIPSSSRIASSSARSSCLRDVTSANIV